MSKSVLTFLLLFITSISILSQKKPYSQSHEAISIRGKIIPSNIQVSTFIKNILFIQEHTEIIPPKEACIFELDEQSKSLLNLDEVILVSINELDEWSNLSHMKGFISIEVYPMKGYPTLFYYKDENLLRKSDQIALKNIKSFWSKPFAGDTIRENDTSLDASFLAPLLIENLNNETEFYIEKNIHYDSFDNSKDYPRSYSKYKISNFARRQLSKLDYPDFNIPTYNATQDEWKNWYNSLPEIDIRQTDVNVIVWRNSSDRYNTNVINKKNILATNDGSDDIYYLSKDSTFVYNTKNRSKHATAGFDPSLTNKKWKSFETENNKEVIDWIGKKKRTPSKTKSLKLENGNTLIVTVENNIFQQDAYIYLMDNDQNVSKGKTIMATIPLGYDNDSGLKIEELLEVDNLYYVFINTGGFTYWNVFDDSIFEK